MLGMPATHESVGTSAQRSPSLLPNLSGESLPACATTRTTTARLRLNSPIGCTAEDVGTDFPCASSGYGGFTLSRQAYHQSIPTNELKAGPGSSTRETPIATWEELTASRAIGTKSD